MKSTKKTKYDFYLDIKKRTRLNPAILFWFGMVYELYVRERLTYEEILIEILKLSGYTGA